MRIRWITATAAAGLALAVLAGCESRETADQREQRLTQRMDRLQMDMDSRIQGVVYKVDTIQTTAVQPQTYAPAPTTVQPIAVAPAEPTAWELERIAAAAREEQLRAASRPAASTNRNYTSLAAKHVRVPGVSVRDVQAALRNAGNNPGGVDGKMGPKTVTAITQFQRQNGLAADGVVGRRTWDVLSAHLPAGGGYK